MKQITYLRDGRAPIPLKESTSRVMSANKAKSTKPEIALRKALWENGLKGYRLNLKNLPGRPDIAFPRKKIAVFVNGCFWHRCDKCKPSFPKTNVEFWSNKFLRNKDRDERKVQQLITMGWEVFVVWECEIKNNLFNIVEKLKNKFL